MAVEVIDKIKPKNSGSFPVVEAVDVAVEGYLNLADAVTHFATDTAIAAINTALNSKANVSDVTASVQNLQGQIDQIVISSAEESVVAPEVAAARVSASGDASTTLKDRIDKIDPSVHSDFLDLAAIDLWSQGGMNPETGWGTDNTNRISNYNFYNVNPGSIMVLIPKSGMKLAYHLYRYNTEYKEVHYYDSGWIDTPKTIRFDERCSMRLMCKYSNDADLVPSEISGNIIKLSVNNNILQYGQCFSQYSSDVIVYTDENTGDEMLKVKLCKDITLIVNDQKYVLNNAEASVQRSLGTIFWLSYDTENGTFSLTPNLRLQKYAQKGTLVIFGWAHWQYPRPVLFGAELNMANQYADYLAPLILGAAGQFVSFDSSTKTITFPNDTLIVSYNQLGPGWNRYYNGLTTAKGNNTCYWGDVASSAIKVYLDKQEDSLIAVNYHDNIPTGTNTKQYSVYRSDRYALVCSFRTNGSVSINAPYKWNGLPFGMEIGGSSDELAAVVKSVNHRGYSTIAPENTIPAYKLSKEMGYLYAECDISLTSDKIPVLLHDNTINRTARNLDGTVISETINIADISYQELLNYDFGIWKSQAYAGTKIPTFQEFMSLCRAIGLRPYIELKTTGYTQEDITGLVNTVKNYSMLRDVTWISFSKSYLSMVKNADPSARLGYLTDYATTQKINDALELVDNNEVFINCNYANLTSSDITKVIDNNLKLEIWTTNSESVIATLNPYISGVTSDALIASKVLRNYAGG